MTKEDIYDQLQAINFKLDEIRMDCSDMGMPWSIIERLRMLALKVEDAAIDCRQADLLDYNEEPEFEADD